MLVLDASSSYDENVSPTLPSGLSFAWTCTYANIDMFGKPCDTVLQGANVTSDILSVPASLMNPQYKYAYQVVASAADGRSSAYTVTVSPQANSSTTTAVTTSLMKLNPDTRFDLVGQVSADYPVDARWSAYVGDQELVLHGVT